MGVIAYELEDVASAVRAARPVDQRSGTGWQRLEPGETMHPEAPEIGDGCSAFFPAAGWPNRGRHGLGKGGGANSYRKCEQQREIPPLRIHCFPPVFVAFLHKPLPKATPLTAAFGRCRCPF